MNLHDHARRTRTLRIAFLVLLATCSTQLAFWLYDQFTYTRTVQLQLESMNRKDVVEASDMLRLGMTQGDVARLYPNLRFDGRQVAVDPAILDQLASVRHHRLNRYAWEGAFFLVVLLGAMAVVQRALLDQAELNRRQAEFLATVSHELKSPLSSLRLSSETLSMRDPPAEQRVVLVERLLQDLSRLERVIGNILDTSRLSEPATHSTPEVLSLAEALTEVVGELELQAAENRTTITCDVPASLHVHADREGVRTVLRNLIDNAVRATAAGTVRITASATTGRTRLEVRDTGAGFTPDVAARLFEKFYRPEAGTRAQRGGTGLGLFLVRRYMELDGGTVHAHSDGAGHGARFTVEWPSAGETA